MSLLAGTQLTAHSFFTVPPAAKAVRGSSFELSIGAIYDSDGKPVEAPYRLEPGHMVQVITAEKFNLPATMTGHVTYKTSLTKRGIWALTIGIVDPGWKGPITTTLLNFSKQDYCVAKGDSFLRVSLFSHAAVPADRLDKPVDENTYLTDLQKHAMAFASTFLDQDEVARKAGESAFEKIRTQAINWVGAVAVIFTLVSLVFAVFQYWSNSAYRGSVIQASDEFKNMQSKVETLEARVSKLETAPTQAPPPRAP